MKARFFILLCPVLLFVAALVARGDIIILQPGSSPTVSERDTTSDQYTISLTAAPGSTVTVYAETLEPNQVNVTSSVTFTPGDWTPKIVTVTAIDDNDIETQPHYVLIRHTVSSTDPAYNGFEPPDILVTINDNDCGSLGYFAEDLNADCNVDFLDYAIVAIDWLSETDPGLDINGNNFVDMNDLVHLASKWLSCTWPGRPICIEPLGFKLFCEYRSESVGVDVPGPRLGWIIETDIRDFHQTAYQVLVATSPDKLTEQKADLWNSGKVISSRSINIAYAGTALISQMRCYWKLRIWDGEGRVSVFSRPSYWQMGLLNPSDWTGIWLNDGKPTPATYDDFFKDDPAPLFRKEFTVFKPVKRATLYISGLGYYKALLNGSQISDAVLDPGWTTYSRRVYYSSCDVTDKLAAGQNCILAELGNGWYNPLPMELFCSFNFRDYLTVGRPRLIARLGIEYTDGTNGSVVTDTTWKVAEGPLLRNNVYTGTKYDARLEIPGAESPGFDDSGWADANQSLEPIGTLRSQLTPPVRVTKTVKPVSLTQPLPGVYIFDMGQNLAGVARLNVSGAAAGARIRMRYGELLHGDGTLDVSTTLAGYIGSSWCHPDPPGMADANDVYICKGAGAENYTPAFTFHGFRYVELTGYPAAPTLDTIEGLRMNSDVNAVGTFACSNPMFNRLWDMFDWTIRSNLFSIQSDCPGREKLGYGGDIVSSSEAVMFDLDMSNFYRKLVRDFNDAVRPNGGLPETAPYVGIDSEGFGDGSGPIGWGTAHPMLLWQLRQYYGNVELLSEQYEVMKNWVDLLSTNAVNYIISNGIGDHASIDPKPVALTSTAFYYYNAKLCADIAAILGLSPDAAAYAALAENIKTAFNNQFFNSATGVYDSGTQCCQAFPLYFDLVPDGYRDLVTSVLIDNITDHSGHLTTGIFATKYMLDELTETGNAYAAYAIANQRTYPGYGYMLDNGATTIWEQWNGGGSRNHPMFGSVCEWFVKALAGISPDPNAVAFDKIIIKPNIIADLSWARASYNSVRGPIESYWRVVDDVLYLDVTIPGNTSAAIYVPAADANDVNESGTPALLLSELTYIGMADGAALFETGSGKYRFTSTSPTIAADNDPPIPATATWNTAPHAISSNSISMSVNSVKDLSGVEYYFDCLTAGGHDSGWRDSTEYTDMSLSPDTQYTYRVKARDKSVNHNETSYSSSASATTYEAGTEPIAFDNASSAQNSSGTSTLSFSHTIGSDPNRLLVVGLAAEDQSVTDLVVSSVTYNAVPMNPVPGSGSTAGSDYRIKTDLYYLLDTALPPAGTYTVAVSYAGPIDNINAGAISLGYVARQQPEAINTNSNTGSPAISTGITTLTDGAWLVDVVGCGNSGSFSTNDPGMTGRWQLQASSSSAAAATKPVTTAGAVTMSWQQSGANRLSHSAAAFAPANVN